MNKRQVTGEKEKASPFMLSEKATLKELLDWLPEKGYERKPSKNMLKRTGFPIAVYEDGELKLSVYPSGYALAEAGRIWRIFDIRDCKDYTYKFYSSAKKNNIYGDYSKVDEEVFMDQPWTVRLILEACDRLEK